MKIGIITDAIDDRHPSYTVYQNNLIKNLKSLDKNNNYSLIHHTTTDSEIYRINKEIIIPLPSFGLLKKSFWRLYLLPYKLKNMDFDLIHDPRGTEPFFFDMPFKKVKTIHDLSSLLYPTLSTMRTTIVHKLFVTKAIKNADRIITVSSSTKRDVIKYLKAPEEKIKVVYNGKNERFKPLNQKEVAEVKQKYNLDFPFILFVGVLQPRKNIPTLIKAYYKLKKEGIKDKLVITGGKGWQYKEIFETVERLNLQKEVIFTGHIPDDDLPKLYNAADLFAFPSLYEGFGIPPLEAMACGIPVITSNTGSLPEVVGDAGIMVDPYDIDGLAKAMYEVLNNEGLKEEMVKKGLERAKMFSWKKCAKEVLDVYEEAYN